MKHFFLLGALALSVVSCDRHEKTNSPSTTVKDVDNTGINVRDRSSMAKTSGDQSESAADRTITQRIRQALMADELLSTNAKNIKIITINGVVTLRGPVASVEEKEVIVRKLNGIQGIERVEDFIEITRTN